MAERHQSGVSERVRFRMREFTRERRTPFLPPTRVFFAPNYVL
jgi:hypothetical protein